MTLVTQTVDAWHEAAYTYLRDQLRTDATVGARAATYRTHMTEIGEVTLAEIVRHPEHAYSAWIVPRTLRPRRQGNALAWTARFEVQSYMTTSSMENQQRFADAQARLRKYTLNLLNRVLDQRDAGITAEKWHDLTPDGEAEFLTVGLEERAILSGTLRFTFDYDTIWMSEGA